MCDARYRFRSVNSITLTPVYRPRNTVDVIQDLLITQRAAYCAVTLKLRSLCRAIIVVLSSDYIYVNG